MAFSAPSPFFTSPNLNSAQPRSPYRRTSLVASVSSEPPSMSASSSLYDVLGIPTTATSHEIKAAYRKLARLSHPDVLLAAVCVERPSPGAEFAQINAAYATLSDPGKRADYDQEVYVRRLSSRAVVPLSQSQRTCRNWETDQCW